MYTGSRCFAGCSDCQVAAADPPIYTRRQAFPSNLSFPVLGGLLPDVVDCPPSGRHMPSASHSCHHCTHMPSLAQALTTAHFLFLGGQILSLSFSNLRVHQVMDLMYRKKSLKAQRCQSSHGSTDMVTAELKQSMRLMTVAAMYSAAVHHCMNLRMAHQPQNPLLRPQSQQSLLFLRQHLVRQVLPGSRVAKLQLQVQLCSLVTFLGMFCHWGSILIQRYRQAC